MPVYAAAARLLERLVAFESTSSASNLELVDAICDLVTRPGVTCERHLSPDGDKANVIVRAGPDTDPESRRGLVLAGHLDVVPAGEPGWSSPPFALTDRGDRWVGRGVCDMKGFIALSLHLVGEVELDRLEAPLVVLLTYDEELGSLGARHLAATRGPQLGLPRATIVGEPTSLRALALTKGHLRLALEIRGRAAHSAFPDEGASAIAAAGPAIAALTALGRRLAAERPPSSAYFEPEPGVTLNIGRIAGGAAVNVVAERCTLDLGLRPLPDTPEEELVERARRAVAAALPDVSWELTTVSSNPAFDGRSSELESWLRGFLGQNQQLGSPFASDAGHLQSLALDCVVWGPGAIEHAHRANEFLLKAEFEQAAGILPRLVERFCRHQP